MSGRSTGRTLRSALEPVDHPRSPPTGPFVNPRLLPIHPDGSPAPYGGVHDAASRGFEDPTGVWQVLEPTLQRVGRLRAHGEQLPGCPSATACSPACRASWCSLAPPERSPHRRDPPPARRSTAARRSPGGCLLPAPTGRARAPAATPACSGSRSCPVKGSARCTATPPSPASSSCAPSRTRPTDRLGTRTRPQPPRRPAMAGHEPTTTSKPSNATPHRL